MAKVDPEIAAHQEWIGFVRPTGLVVSAPALVRAGAILDRRDAEGQRLLRGCVAECTFDQKEGPVPHVPDFRAFAQSVLGWSFSPRGYAGVADGPIPPELEIALADDAGTLRPDLAVRELHPKDGAPSWQLLVSVLEPGEDLDRAGRGHGRLGLSPHSAMERLLRQTGVPAGVLFNGRTLRLLSAPRGESSGWLDFRVADMAQTAGRPISTALRLLLGEPRLLSLPRQQRLAALLEESRKFQNEVSERLAEQVLQTLYELLRGLQAANDASRGELLRQPLAEHPDDVYRGLLTVILRLVFLLYAEERDMLPEDETFLRYYSLAGLHERLREDAALFPDTMDQRYGAWAQLLVLFRMVHDGARSGAMRLPRRYGALFDPDRFKFLEGRPSVGARQIHERIEPPLVSDGTVYRALEKLLVLDGERISYRALDVEEIGSVYQAMMGFRLETATGRSVAIRSQKKWGAPTAVDLDALVREPASARDRWLQDRADRKLPDSVKRAVAAAATVEDLHAALQPVIDPAATPDLVPQSAMVLQPSEERRRSGSHYTPRALTKPIVETTLAPVLARLRGADGRRPRPEQILDLKVCDPAMGSGAFLVEACRQLGEALVESWRAHGETPAIPPDEDEVVFARRLVAQRCLYGVDRNPVAVDLAKVSLWLATLARDHALTFLDHALRHGDSLVGLSRTQIEAFHWDGDAPRFQVGLESMHVREHLTKVAELRTRIREADETVPDWELRDLWDAAQTELAKLRLLGDLTVSAFFEGQRPNEREAKRVHYAGAVLNGEAERYIRPVEERRHDDPPLAPFHWQIEFPEVFERASPGFDSVVGNPPFLHGRRISVLFGAAYLDFLVSFVPEGGGLTDIAAYFFRRAFGLIRRAGTMGLLATNTIAQGDTRTAGLCWICNNGGTIYAARRREKWPGLAAVVVSIVHVIRASTFQGTMLLDGRRVDRITAFLFHAGGSDNPAKLAASKHRCFQGQVVLGMGFTFDDENEGATPLSVMRELTAHSPACDQLIKPYMGGEETNSSPTLSPHRYVIDFGQMSEEEARAYAPLYEIVAAKVRPQRLESKREQYKRLWWLFAERQPAMLRAIAGLERVITCSYVTAHFALCFQPARRVFANSLAVFAFDGNAAFGILQSRLHELWARFFSSSMKDDLRYTPSDCFETFPFPENWETHPALEAAGQAYYEFRAALMVRNNEGLTKTYNRFHDPNELDPEILRLRALHADMDRAVLDAYGWGDIPTDCKFLLDYEIDEEEWGDRKKPSRYRWPDDVRDEVLARLLELNAARAQEEARAGAAADRAAGAKGAPRRPTPRRRP
jgi:hypothetical protein